jgi:diacylglycerol kinase family enzyme
MRGDASADASADLNSVCVVMNPGAGSKDENGRDAIGAALKTVGLRHEILVADGGQDLTNMARDAAAKGWAVVAAAGGDGTINAVAQGLAGGPARLGVIPLGTFNYVARSLGLPQEIEGAAQVLAEGRPRRFPLARVNGRVFLNNASLGAYPAILRRRETIYRKLGRSRMAAHWSALETLASFRATMRLQVVADGRVMRRRTPLVFVARNAYQLELFGLEGGEHVEAGRFAVFVAPDGGRGALVAMAARLAAGRLRPGEDVEMFAAQTLEIATNRRQRLVARDGERERMQAPFRFEIKQDALQVIAPVDGDSDGNGGDGDGESGSEAGAASA